MMYLTRCLFIIHGAVCVVHSNAHVKPNILFMLADDLGFADVEYHDGHIETPNIASLAKEGVILENYYVAPLCTPTRAAFHTGRFPIKLGLQEDTPGPFDPYGLNPTFPTIADAFRIAGYSTHAFGKWHLGFCNEQFLPLNRGYDSFYGFLNGEIDYYSKLRDSIYDYYHTVDGKMEVNWALNGSNSSENIDPSQPGCFSVHDLTYQVEMLVKDYPLTEPSAKPLFIYLAFQSVHAPMMVPRLYEEKYLWMQERATYAGLVSSMDEAVGNITRAFRNKDPSGSFWKNTLLIFSTDNGGNGLRNGKLMGNNYPLIGGKGSLFEGGTRGVAFIHGYGVKKSGYSNYQMMHAVDWLPTLLHKSMKDAPSNLLSLLDGIDGLDVWDALMSNATSPRTEFVYNIETEGKFTKHIRNGAVRKGCYKLLVGSLEKSYRNNRQISKAKAEQLAQSGQSGEEDEESVEDVESSIEGPLLFNVCQDPSEKNDLYDDDSVKIEQKNLEKLLEEYRLDMIPAVCKRLTKSFPKKQQKQLSKDNAWGPWGCDIHKFARLRPEREISLRRKFLAKERGIL